MAFPITTLETARLRLRPFRTADAPDVHSLWHDQDYLRFAPAALPTAGASLERAERWCAAEIPASFAVVTTAADDRLCGHVALFDANWDEMTCELHYWTLPAARGHGYAPEAARAVAEWALREHGFARVTLLSVVQNLASRKVADAAGFRFEGILRNATLTRSGRADLASYSLIPEDL